jgi:tape measure domain-containing protein
MANSIAKLAILLTTDASGVSKGFAQAKSAVQGFNAGLGGSGGGMTAMLSGMATKAGAIGAAFAGIGTLVAGATWATKLAADAEQVRTSFEVMLGSASKAQQMVSDIQGFAASTPFESAEIAQASKSLLAFGVAQEQIIPSMRMLGDLASGLGIPIGELSELYGKAKVQGRLFAEDINQLQGRGIPIVKQLAKNFGVAETEIRKMVEEGKVGFPQLQAALFELTKEGSQFGGMMEKQSKTFWGQLSTLWDNIKIAVGGVGKQFIGVLTEMLKLVNAALEQWNRFWGNVDSKKLKPGGVDMKQIAEGMNPANDAMGKMVKDATEAAAKHLEDLQKRGESLAQSLRTPFEQITDSLAEAYELLQAGAISAETYARAQAKAREDLAAQAESADKIRSRLQQQNSPVAALQFGTQAANSALNAANAEQKIQAELQKQMVIQQKEANDRLRRIENAIKGKETITVQEVTL